MKTTSILVAGMFAVGMAFSFNAIARSDSSDSGVAAEQAKPKMKSHSHIEEKISAMAKAPASEEDKPVVVMKSSATDLSKHFHPRDGGK